VTPVSLEAAARRVMRFVRYLWSRRYDWQGKAVGSLIGLAGGLFGVVTGAIVGHMTDILLRQGRADRALVRYLENPGPHDIEECAPGAASFCALATLLALESKERRRRGGLLGVESIGTAALAAETAAAVFGLSREFLPALESYSRVAASMAPRLNRDLLAESLAARRAKAGDGAALAAALSSLARGAGAEELAREAAAILDPAGAARSAALRSLPREDDPWRILDLPKGASIDQVKASFRALAVRFHPDALSGLGEDREREAAAAFRKIESAYREILRSVEG